MERRGEGEGEGGEGGGDLMIAPVCMFKHIFRVPLCVVASSTEHHERVAGQFVQNAHQITILEQVGSPLHKSNKLNSFCTTLYLLGMKM